MQMTQRKRTLLIWLTVDYSLVSKDAKSGILWSIYCDQLSQSEVGRNKVQKMYQIAYRAYVTRPQTQRMARLGNLHF